LSVGTNLDEAGLAQDPQVPRNAGLVDADLFDDVVDRALSAPKGFDDGAARWVGEDFEEISMHRYAYA
jgi:hypothetical protein